MDIAGLSTIAKVAGLLGVVVAVAGFLLNDVIATSAVANTPLEPAQAYSIILAVVVFAGGLFDIAIVAWLMSVGQATDLPVPLSSLWIISFLVLADLGGSLYVAVRPTGPVCSPEINGANNTTVVTCDT
jgi:hypothetical protein